MPAGFPPCEGLESLSARLGELDQLPQLAVLELLLHVHTHGRLLGRPGRAHEERQHGHLRTTACALQPPPGAAAHQRRFAARSTCPSLPNSLFLQTPAF